MQKQLKSAKFSFIKAALLLSGLVGVLFAGAAFASVSGASLTDIAANVNKSVASLAVVLSDIALLAGIGFVMASFFKFHQHKLNPTQVPLSQGITLVLIGAGLMLFPYMLPTATRAVFGTKAKIAKTGGGQIGQLIGTGSTGG